MKRIVLIFVLIVLAAGGASALTWWLTHQDKPRDELTLYGNMDLRQVELAFNNSERIATVLVQEGDRVRRGQVVAKLDVSRLEPQVNQAAAQVAAQRAAVERLHNGSRPEEIAQAKANVDAAKADAHNAHLQFDRLEALSSKTSGRGVSQEDIDNARAALDVADGKLAVNDKALDLTVLGPRKEDIAQAQAVLQANEAQLALLRQELADAVLVAPIDAVVRSRLMEAGEMASPQKPVYTLAITDPKWVRAYVTEPDLGKVHPGMAAKVKVDGFEGRQFDGWVGFVSSIAEFTPKAVQTDELRTKLVYEVRVFVKDAADDLRLGMPATVHLPLNAATQPATSPDTNPAPRTPVTEGSQ